MTFSDKLAHSSDLIRRSDARQAHLAQQAAGNVSRFGFNPIAVDNREESGLCQEPGTPALMNFQQALQTGAFWQPSKQRPIIPRQPTVERPEVTTFECKQQPYRHQFAWIQLGLSMFWYIAHLIVYPAEQFNDKVFRGHGSYLQQFANYRLYDVRDLFSTSTIGY
jgi:hypothetical protein